MEKYRITFKASVAKALRSIPNNDVKRILQRVDKLTDNPRAAGCIKLSGEEKYRVRQGIYRIVYEIRDETLVINVVKIGHRSSVYSN